MALLNEDEAKRIADAVAEAEKSSGGEIATAIIAESDDYGFQELIFAIIVGFAAFSIATAFAGSLEGGLQRLFWSYSTWHLATSLGLISLVAGAVAYFLAQIPAIDRLIVSRRRMAEAVRRRATRHFMEAGVHDTIDKTGILLFVSLLERRVELIADRGINEKVDAGTWDEIVAQLTAGIAAGRAADAIVVAVTACGEILSGKVVRRSDDKNELDDGPAELGRGS